MNKELKLKFLRYFVDMGMKNEPSIPEGFILQDVDPLLFNNPSVQEKKFVATPESFLFDIANDYFTHYAQRITDSILIDCVSKELESAVAIAKHIEIVTDLRKLDVVQSEFEFIFEGLTEELNKNKVLVSAVKISEIAKTDPTKAIEYGQKEFSILLTGLNSAHAKKAPKTLPDFITYYLDNFKHKNEFISPVAEYGFSSLDKMSGGLFPGELTLIMAGPSVGKSYIVQEMAYHNGINLRKPTVYATNEITADQLWVRICAANTGIPINKFIRNACTKDEVDFFVSAMEELRDRGNDKFVILDSENCRTVSRLQASIISVLGNISPDIIVYDHLNNAVSEGNSRADSVERVAHELKNLAGFFNSAVVSPTHTNRGGNNNSELTISHVQYQSLTQIADTIYSVVVDPANEPQPPAPGEFSGTSGILIMNTIRGRSLPIGYKVYLRIDPSLAAVTEASFVDTITHSTAKVDNEYGDILG